MTFRTFFWLNVINICKDACMGGLALGKGLGACSGKALVLVWARTCVFARGKVWGACTKHGFGCLYGQGFECLLGQGLSTHGGKGLYTCTRQGLRCLCGAMLLEACTEQGFLDACARQGFECLCKACLLAQGKAWGACMRKGFECLQQDFSCKASSACP